MLLTAVRRTIERHSMMARGDRVVVAVSGGADSMALLHALAALREDLGFGIVVAHLDHGLRPSSADDARFVVDAAGGLGVDVVCERQDVAALAASRRRGIEETARDARREFLYRVADEHGAARIALGHTADDQAETVLFRLARGTGWNGLCGMEAAGGRFIRPLLSVRRDDARGFLVERGVSWREDATNADLRFARNRLRECVLPELEAVNPEAVRAVARAAELARDAREVEHFAITRVWPDVCLGESREAVEISRPGLAALPRAVQSIVLREAMRRARGDLNGIARSHVAAAQRLAERERGELHLPRLQVSVTPSSVSLSAKGAEAARGEWSVPVGLGRTKLSELDMVVDVSLGLRGEVDVARGPWAEVADADCVRFPLVARGRRAGDVFAPLGMERDVRLKSFLINARVPREQRDRLVLVCDQEKIVWVAGVRLSHRARLRDATRRVLVLRAEEVER